MRHRTVALMFLALAPAGGLAQVMDFEGLPAPPHLDLCGPCSESTLESFLIAQDVPALPPELDSPYENPAPVADPWQNLWDLRKGQPIRVLDANSQKLDARFLGVSADALEVQVNKQILTLAREDVLMVSLKPPSKAKRVLLAILGGAVAGFSLWAKADRRARNCWDDDGYDCETDKGLSPRSAAIATAAGAGIAGVVAGFLKADELVIYSNQWSNTPPPPLSDSPWRPESEQ